MRQSPSLFSGLLYFLLGALFTYFAIQDVRESGWSIFTILLVFLATFDLGSGLKMIYTSVFHKKRERKK